MQVRKYVVSLKGNSAVNSVDGRNSIRTFPSVEWLSFYLSKVTVETVEDRPEDSTQLPGQICQGWVSLKVCSHGDEKGANRANESASIPVLRVALSFLLRPPFLSINSDFEFFSTILFCSRTQLFDDVLESNGV